MSSNHNQAEVDLSAADKQQLLERVSGDLSPMVELAHSIGVDGIEAVMQVFGGQKPHIPLSLSFWHKLARELRNEEIRANFNGRNYRELAERYSGYLGLGTLGERHVREIVHASHKKAYQRPRERGLPVKLRRDCYGEISALAQQSDASMAEVMDVVLVAALHSPEVKRLVQCRLKQSTVPAKIAS